MPEGQVLKGYIVPGLAPLAFAGNGGSFAKLRQAYRAAGEHIARDRPELIVFYSTQWISVLGHLFQADPNPHGVHVDDNWHYMGDLPFSFKVDVNFAAAAVKAAEAMGLQARTVNYEGFPVDTGTLVAHRLLGVADDTLIGCVSCNIYAGRDELAALGRATAEAIRKTGRRAVVVACTGLSSHFFTHDVLPEADSISKGEDDEWNRKMLDLMSEGQGEEVTRLIPQFAKIAAADMMFKAFHWLTGAMGRPDAKGLVLGYGPIWGTGAAVVEYDLAHR